MRAHNSLVTVLMALGVLVGPAVAGRSGTGTEQAPAAPPRRVELPVQPAPMGDYEVVPNWPKPLPDTDLSHAGWTWGSGSGVWAESPDKVWVSQRGEIELPPGATPWICPCLLDPRRTNTGRRPYSGKGYTYQMRRHHLVFAVDRNGNTIEEWLQHDAYLRPERGTGLGELARGPHKLLIDPYDPEKHIWIIDDDMHEINIFTNDGKKLAEPSPQGASPAETAAACRRQSRRERAPDPKGCASDRRPSSRSDEPIANSSVFVLPITGSPAARQRAATVASKTGT